VPSGIAALLVATVTLWMVIVDWLRPKGHKPSARVLFGIVLGFAGMVILVGPAKLGLSGRVDPVGAGVLIAASLAWACASPSIAWGELAVADARNRAIHRPRPATPLSALPLPPDLPGRTSPISPVQPVSPFQRNQHNSE